MIDLYTWSTPNGRKISIMLEECGFEYKVHPVNILANEQFDPKFLKISPNNKIPAIVDRKSADGKPYSLFESGAILIYLAEKSGKFMPKDVRGCYDVIQWLMFQMGGVGPMLGQAHHFLHFNKGKAPYAEERYGNEAKRLYGVMDRRLSDHEYFAGDYSIADIAIFPWLQRCDWQGIDMADFPNVKRWYDQIAKRPAVQRGMSVPSAPRP
jgi:GST-like protein